jgi:hypothetical protein
MRGLGGIGWLMNRDRVEGGGRGEGQWMVPLEFLETLARAHLESFRGDA